MKRRDLLALATMLPLAGQVRAQSFPTRSIRFVVPFAPGGTSEIVARVVAQELTQQMGQTVYVENKAGGAGTIAMSEVAKAPPDGYTLIQSHVGTFAVNPYAMARQPYNVDRDFLPVGLLARVPHIKSGKLRALAVGTPQRIASLPDVPTVAELGYADFETSQWYGVHVPAGTPREIVMRLNAEINKALRTSAVTQRFASDNAAAGIGSPEDYAAFIRKEQARWQQVVKRANIVID